MTIQNAGRGRVEGFACDECSESLELDDPADFNDAWAQARADGWRAEKTDEGWRHLCPGCARRARTS